MIPHASNQCKSHEDGIILQSFHKKYHIQSISFDRTYEFDIPIVNCLYKTKISALDNGLVFVIVIKVSNYNQILVNNPVT